MGKVLDIETKTKTISSLLKDIKAGDICVPPFQRDFVWERDNIKDLFDSISKNYPIGSILIWKPVERMSWNGVNEIGSFKMSATTDNDWYVLDGFQRLSSLFGCLTNPEKSRLSRDEEKYNNYFNLYYDLKSEEFLYLKSINQRQPYQIPLYVLMSSSDFRQYSRMYMEPSLSSNDVSIYQDRADSMSNRLLEYRIACIEICNANIEEAVDIFSRLNSKGVEITYDWMVNALSYKDETFVFADEISNVRESLKQYSFEDISRNAIFRCIQSSFGKLYIDQTDIEKLARREDFVSITKQTIPLIVRAVQFLHDELYVSKYQLLPYNIQLIFIMEFFRQLPEPSIEQLESLKHWFWKTTYSNYFTINTLSFQRKAYNSFLGYLSGINKTMFYEGDDKEPYITMPFPKSVSLKGVRSKALVLFMKHKISLNFDNVSSYNSIDSFDSEDYNKFFDQNRSRIIDEEQRFVESLGLKYFEHNENSYVSERIDSNFDNQSFTYTSPLLSGSVVFDYKKNNGIYRIGTGVFEFNTLWSECGENSIYCYSDMVKRLGYNPNISEFPDLRIIPENFDFSSRVKSLKVGNVVVLENRDGHFAAIKIYDINRGESDINHLIKFEYKIYD